MLFEALLDLQNSVEQGGQPMNEGGWAEAATAVYNALSKHHLRHYAPGPGGLDWANQPNPFRRFEGSLVVFCRWSRGRGCFAYDHLFRPAEGSGSPLDGPSLGLFFELSFGLSAWKGYGPSRWARRSAIIHRVATSDRARDMQWQRARAQGHLV